MNPAAVPAVLIGVGLATVVVAAMARAAPAADPLRDALDLPFGARGARPAGTPSPWLHRVDPAGSLASALARAGLPVRPDRFVVAVAATALTAAGTGAVVLGTAWAGLASLLAAPPAAATWVRHRTAARRAALEAAVPDALAVLAGSVAAGHTFLRALQLLAEEAEEPLRHELAAVVRETEVGAVPVDALARMAERSGVEDLRWVVQAIRVQQEVGGRLADLLHTLADVMRARQDLRREVRVLTAEGRLSMYVLAGLPVLLVAAMHVLNPGYLAPMLRGAGLAVLGAAALSVAAGVAVVRRLIRIEV